MCAYVHTLSVGSTHVTVFFPLLEFFSLVYTPVLECDERPCPSAIWYVAVLILAVLILPKSVEFHYSLSRTGLMLCCCSMERDACCRGD